MQFLWHILARILTSSPRLVDWIIRRAQRTPYTHITSASGDDIYMGRWWLFNPYGRDANGEQGPARFSWLPSIRIHHIRRPDQDRDLHDHPWNARTIVLRGWYREERLKETCTAAELRAQSMMKPVGLLPDRAVFKRSAGYTGRLLFGQYHRISSVSTDGVWTLFITWKKRGTWGFLVNGKKVPWRTYLGLDPITIQRGQALVLVGPQGCGKTTKARELAAKAGKFVEISGEDLASDFRLGTALANEPATVIVEVERSLDQRAQIRLKQLITNDRAVCYRKGRPSLTVRTPNFIFCSQNAAFLPSDGRRFWVVDLSKGQHATAHHPV